MPTVRELSERYVNQLAVLDPTGAILNGLPGRHDGVTDYSPEGEEGRALLQRSVLAESGTASVKDEDERIGLLVMRERILSDLALYEAGEWMRPLRNLASPLQLIRLSFDAAPVATTEDLWAMATRLRGVEMALASLRQTLQTGMDRGVTASKRQTLVCAGQSAAWGRRDGGFFHAYVAKFAANRDERLQTELLSGADMASEAMNNHSNWLRTHYLTKAHSLDSAGEVSYGLWAQSALGSSIDVLEAYQYGLDKVDELRTRMQEVSQQILPDAPLREVMDRLESDPHRCVEGEESFRRWLQDLMNRTIEDLNGTHFDIPERVQQLEAMIAPPGGSAAMYYTPPSEDFRRPGRTWYPTLGRTHFPLWSEVSTAYHEGVPGHHLQLGMSRHRSSGLTSFQRIIAFIPAYSEGLALYAERLMFELGYLDDPALELGMLRMQLLRAMRVVVDIGLHLNLSLPKSSDFRPGGIWTAEIALEWLIRNTGFNRTFLESEVTRYLGWPGQAISYALGERAWLEVRERCRRQDPEFNLKDFHARALNLGPMGLDLLHAELVR